MILLAVALLSASPAHTGAMTVFQSLIVRIRGRGAPSPAIAYHEKRGPRCIDAAGIAGAAVIAPDSVDFGLKGGDRVRAHLEQDCPALDYYRGFYVTPQPDGRICADRDAIRTRSGGECGIDRFRRLIPEPPPAPAAKP